MGKYAKPKMMSSGYYPEPVETGCCLRSCGALRMGDGSSLKGENNVELQKLNNAIKEAEK